MSSDCFHVNASFSKRREVEFFQRKRDKNCQRPSPKRSFLYTSHSYLNTNQMMPRPKLSRIRNAKRFKNVFIWILLNVFLIEKISSAYSSIICCQCNAITLRVFDLFNQKRWMIKSQHSLQPNTHVLSSGIRANIINKHLYMRIASFTCLNCCSYGIRKRN